MAGYFQISGGIFLGSKNATKSEDFAASRSNEFATPYYLGTQTPFNVITQESYRSRRSYSLRCSREGGKRSLLSTHPTLNQRAPANARLDINTHI